MNCNYKVKLDDIQNKYKFNIFCTGSYNDSDLRKMIESVFYALPRTTGTGTSVTLNDTAFSYMKNKLYATDTSQEGTPTPETPQTIHTISGDNEVVVCGKNLFDIELEQNAWNNSNGTGTVWSNKYVRTQDYIEVKPNTQYAIDFEIVGDDYKRGNILSYDNNKDFINSVDITQAFTTGNSTHYLKFNFFATNNITPSDVINIQLELGTVTPYEPYQSNSVLLTLGDKEICKIGNYEDKIFKVIKGNEVYDSLASEEKATLDYGKWYLRKNINKVVLNGNASEQWISQNMTNVYGYFHPQYDIKRNGANTTTTGYLCNYFSEVTPNQNWTTAIGNSNFAIASTSSDIIITKGDTTNEVEQFKTWLSTHNTIVYYVLATPTNELFNDTIQEQLEDIYNNMLSYEGQTNVSQVNDDLPFNINSTAIKDLNNL